MSNPAEPNSNPYESPRAIQKQQCGKASNSTLATRITLSFVLAAAFGAGVWALSPFLSGKDEPWDASLPTYFISMLIGGFVFAAICPRRFWVSVVGVYIGQIAYCLAFLDVQGATVILLLISVGFFSVPAAFAGAITLFAVWRLWIWSRN
jgi:hypothetical protein